MTVDSELSTPAGCHPTCCSRRFAANFAKLFFARPNPLPPKDLRPLYFLGARGGLPTRGRSSTEVPAARLTPCPTPLALTTRRIAAIRTI